MNKLKSADKLKSEALIKKESNHVKKLCEVVVVNIRETNKNKSKILDLGQMRNLGFSVK